ncbi:MAG: isochorismatase family protein [Candidatus Limnocylindria bacterium]
MDETPAFDARTALIVVDLQNDFADPLGSLAVEGGAAIVPRVTEVVRSAEAGGALVVATQDWHPASTPHFAKDGGIWPVHCVGDTWGAEIHPDLALPPGALRIRKGVLGEDGYSGFTTRDPISGEETATGLEDILLERGIERVVICGLATDYCVRATALDARRMRFAVVVLTDAVRPVDLEAGDGERALRDLAAAGVTTS